jgi:hypothetical protein
MLQSLDLRIVFLLFFLFFVHLGGLRKTLDF